MNTELNEKQIKCLVKFNKRPRYYKDNWGIAEVEVAEIEYGLVKTDDNNCIVIKGDMPEPNYINTFVVVANEVEDPSWGLQYEIVYMCVQSNLEDEDAQREFLSQILTPRQIENIYATLPNPFEVFKNEDVMALTKVKGIGLTTAVSLIEKYKENIDYSFAYIELNKYGLTSNMIKKIVDEYGSPEIAVSKVKENPYVLADDVNGIGWVKADNIALSMGIHPHSPFRIKAFIRYFLEVCALEGNSYVSPSYLMDGILENIGEEIEDEQISIAIHEMADELWWDKEKTKIGLKKYFQLEFNIAKELMRILNGENNFVYDNWREVIKEVEKRQGWEYTEQQIEGIETVLKNQVVVVTGYGGTGKTSVVSGMLKVLFDYVFCQCALSGRAAARMTEVTGEDGYTIHRLLDYNPAFGFGYHDKNRLPYDIIIVDEISMIGGELFYYLIRAIKTGAKLILIGDVGQLESIGILNVASDIINSGTIPVVNLTEIHRQAKKSAIITESINVRKGIQIIQKGFVGREIRGELQDLELDIYKTKAFTKQKIIEKFKEHLPKVNSIFDIQVIVPMKTNGDASTFNLNKELQSIYNPYSPAKKEIELPYAKGLKYTLRVGDKVINTRNNYKTMRKDAYDNQYTPIYNGDMGIVTEIDDYTITVDFNRVGEIIIPKKHRRYIELGYACTCHKYQGSESKIVIIGLDYSSFVMLTREWVYTAITRAREYCCLCAESDALYYAVTQTNVPKKKTHLKNILQDYSKYVFEQIA